MRYGFLITIIFIASGFSEPTQAQQQLFKNYTMNDGLVSSSIRRIFQDSKGFLWIGTWEGLSKYDGHTFTNYSTANGLSHNFVNDFYETATGNLQVALNNGVINVISGNKILKGPGKPGVVVNHFSHDAGHTVLASTDEAGVFEFNNGQIKQLPAKFLEKDYFDIAWINDSLFMVVGDSSINVYNKNYELIARKKDVYSDYPETRIFKDKRNRIWLGTSAGLRLLNSLPQKNAPIVFATLPPPFNIAPLNDQKVKDIFEEDNGTMWFATNAGLVKIDARGVSQLITVKDGLASNIVTCIFQDREKTIWFGTAVGLSKMATRTSIKLFDIEAGVWSSDNMYLLLPVKKDKLLVSTKNGVRILNKKTGVFSAIANGKDLSFYSVLSGSSPPLLMSYLNMTELDTNTLNFHNAEPLPIPGSFRFAKDRDGNYFSSDLDHLFFNAGTLQQTILNYRVSSLFIDKSGDIWAATWRNGVFRIRYRFQKGHINITKLNHFLPQENIRCTYEDIKGNIWLGTRYNGVYRFTKNQNDSFSVLNINQGKGLTSNFVKEIREDSKGNFWIAFYQGLDKLLSTGNGFRVFNFSRVNNYFTSNVGMLIDQDDVIWLATGEGVVKIIDGETEKIPPLPVYVTKVFSKDSSFDINEDHIALSYRQNQIQFEFSSPGFLNENQVLYSYRLSGGAAAEWTPASNQHVVSFASLKPGDYVFEVRSLGWNGEWGRPAKFGFLISPPFWQTIWFILLLTLAVVTFGWWLFKRRIKTVRHETEMKQKIAETEMMALRAQMNPHFIFNCLNSIDNLIQMDEKERATLYLSKFAKLIRSILENSVNNLVPCWKDMDTLQLYLELEALRFDHKFSYKVEVESDILNGDYKVPPLVIQPFVENAIHHGLLNKIAGDKTLFIRVFVTDSHIHYIVQDNGIGRKKAATYKQQNKLSYGSMGIQITEERINIFNQAVNGSVIITDMHDEFNEPSGTKVEVSLIIQP